MTVGTSSQRESFLDPSAGRPAEPGSQVWLADQALHGSAQRLSIARRNNHAAVRIEYFPDATDIGRNAWQAQCHGLEQRKRQVLVHGRQDERIGVFQLRVDIGSITCELDVVSARRKSRDVLAAPTVIAISNHPESQVGPVRGERHECLNQKRSGLARRE